MAPEELPATDGTQNNPATIWNKQAPVNPRKLFPKRKYKWGMLEVMLSLLILVCTQIVLALAVIIYFTQQSVIDGIEASNIDKIQQQTADFIMQPYMILLSSGLMYVSWLFMMWYSTHKRGLKSWAKDFWLRAKWPRDIVTGVGLGILASASIQGLSMLLTALGVDLSGSDNTAPFTNQDLIWKVILLFGLVSIIGPAMEEFFFRGFLLQAFIRHFRRGNVHEPRSPFGYAIQQNSAWLFNAYLASRNWCYKHKYILSAIISSVLFGFMHFQLADGIGPWITVAITASLGFVFALVTIKTQRLAPAIFAHMTYNCSVAILTFFIV